MSFAAREDTGILNTLGRVCAGCTASVCALTLTNPLDVIKSRLQIAQSTSVPMKSSVDWVCSMLRKEKTNCLVKGLVPAISQSLSCNILYYSCYSTIYKLTESRNHSIFSRHFIAGFTGNLFVSFLRVPLEAVKCRQQLCTERFLPTLQILKRLWREKRLYKGASMILLRDLIPGGLYSAIFFASRQKLEGNNGVVNPVISKFLLGGTMGAIYWFLAYPFDLIRNIQQSTEQKSQATVKNAAKAIIKSYGTRGLYRGLLVTIVKSFITCGISLSLFDTFLKALDVDFN
eukprot:TRINITY_DN0_c141_g1_i2.p1 TRINITY_DN0_c141_g1~~TRINITY_DN0_c141_g1_i2.p1  ORF type:complete len:288 (-),score=45.22 TRINITY_DN0_c141_g1_i2:57-920(-)